ncbi:embigin [Leptodactylus fuscus]|uniref:embigin n=1 Tax=Leptodactylus fuscus TaxID=238119 RepID=UPI003F4ED8AC
MKLRTLHALLLPLCCGVFSVASPGINSNTAGPNVTPEDPVHDEDGFSNYTSAEHSISITGFSAKDIKKDIIVYDEPRLKLECNLIVESNYLDVNVSWKHGEELIRSDLYTSNNTGNQWRTTYEFVVTDTNKTGDYRCIFSSATAVIGTFRVQVPPVHGGNKALITYNGDEIVLKCDVSTYKPQQWLWYKVNGSERVQLNFSLDPKRYKELSEKRNETKLHISNLSENDGGTYVCRAVFKTVESEGQVEIAVLSYLVPLKVFLVIAAEVVILVTVILVYEIMSKKKQSQEDVKKDYEPMAQLKSEDSSLAEASTTRQRKV